ncbi:MAG: c-type cytochrome [Alphaproteobacteria bacterium]
MTTIRTVVSGILAIIVLGLAATAPVMADEHEIKFRKTVMKAVGGSMGGMASVLRGQAPANLAVPLAESMSQLARVVPHVFPEGSDFGETTVTEAIWEKPAEFKKAVDAFTTAAAAMPAAAGKGGDAFGAAFGALGKTCKGCHENFRKKKEDQ